MLLLVVPTNWTARLEGFTELRRCPGENHGGRLMLRMTSTPLRPSLAHYCRLWGWAELRLARRDLTTRIQGAFSSLAWLDLKMVG